MTDVNTHGAEVADLLRDLCGDGPFGSWSGGAMHRGDGAPITLVDPSTGAELLTYPDAGPAVVDRVMEAARAAQAEWMALTASDRGRVMTRIGGLVRDHAETLAALDMIVGGKPRAGAMAQVEAVAAMFDYYAGWCDKLHGEVIPLPTSHLNYTLREPLGVAVQTTPWNAPVFTAGWQIAPAIAAGNAAVLKPSELTPASSVALGALCERAGAPPGLVGIVAGFGHSSGQAALDHPAAAIAVFVGSTETGARIAATAARRVLPCILELGGKSANIVFDDADMDRAAEGAADAIFAASGQSCVAGARLLVQSGAKDAMLGRLAEICAGITVGAADDATATMGPIQNRAQLEKIERLVGAALDSGARLVCGGQPGRGAPRGLLLRPHDPRGGRSRGAHRPGRGVRPRPHRADLRDRGGGDPDRECDALRPCRRGLDPGRGQGAPRGRQGPRRDILDQFLQVDQRDDALRGIGPERPWSIFGTGGATGLYPYQVRLGRNGRLTTGATGENET